jgi:hypothetical protein
MWCMSRFVSICLSCETLLVRLYGYLVVERCSVRCTLTDTYLVAQDAREQTLWIVSVEGVDVGVAQRVGHHLDADLARPRVVLMYSGGVPG